MIQETKKIFITGPVTVIALLLLLITGSCGSDNEIDESWQRDISLLCEKIGSYHPQPWRYVTEAEFKISAEQIIKHSSGWKKTKTVVEMMKLIAMLGDGHSEISLNNMEEFNLWYPVRMELFNDGLYITGIDNGYKDLLRYKVVKIGDMNADEAIGRVSKIISLDDKRGLSRVITNYLSNAVILKTLGITDSEEKMFLKATDSNGDEMTVKINSQPWNMATNWAYYRSNVPVSSSSATIYDDIELPLFLKNVINDRKAYWFEYMPEDRVLMFQFNDVNNSGNESFSGFIERMFGFYDANSDRIEKFVIDVRFNEGGDGSLIKPLVQKFIKRSDRLTRGKLYIITGRNTFSAASNFIGQMLENTSAVTVGDIAAGPLNWNSDIIKFELPGNNILVNISTMAWQKGHPTDTRGYYPPEVFVPTCSSDVFGFRDAPLEAILNNEAVPLKDILINKGISAFEDELNRRTELSPDTMEWFPYTSFDLTLFAFQDLIPQGKLDEALVISRLNATFYPENIRAKYITAMILEAKGELNEALGYLDQLAEKEPYYVEAVWDRDRLKAVIDPAPLNSEIAVNYTGDYEGERVISLKDDKLWYTRNGSAQLQLLPVDDHVFFIENSNSKMIFLSKDGSDGSLKIFSYNGRGYTYNRIQ